MNEHKTSAISVEQESYSLGLSFLHAVAAAVIAWALTRRRTHGRLR